MAQEQIDVLQRYGHLEPRQAERLAQNIARLADELDSFAVRIPLVLRISNAGGQDATLLRLSIKVAGSALNAQAWSTETPADWELVVPQGQIKEIDEFRYITLPPALSRTLMESLSLTAVCEERLNNLTDSTKAAEDTRRMEPFDFHADLNLFQRSSPWDLLCAVFIFKGIDVSIQLQDHREVTTEQHEYVRMLDLHRRARG